MMLPFSSLSILQHRYSLMERVVRTKSLRTEREFIEIPSRIKLLRRCGISILMPSMMSSLDHYGRT